jgi:hypothetical protein
MTGELDVSTAPRQGAPRPRGRRRSKAALMVVDQLYDMRFVLVTAPGHASLAVAIASPGNYDDCPPSEAQVLRGISSGPIHRGQCPGCGEHRILPGLRPVDGAAICTRCAGFRPSYACSRCEHIGANGSIAVSSCLSAPGRLPRPALSRSCVPARPGSSVRRGPSPRPGTGKALDDPLLLQALT